MPRVILLLGHNVGEVVAGDELSPCLNALLESLPIRLEDLECLPLNVILVTVHVTLQHPLVVVLSQTQRKGNLAEASKFFAKFFLVWRHHVAILDLKCLLGGGGIPRGRVPS